MKTVIEGELVKVVERNGKNGTFRLVTIGDRENYERIELFAGNEFVIPDGIKKGSPVKVEVEIYQVGYNIKVRCSGISLRR